MPISHTKLRIIFLVAIIFIPLFIFDLTKLKNKPTLNSFSTINSQNKETDLEITSNSSSSPLRYGCVFPEGSDMDLSFVPESLQKNPNIQFYPYPHQSPQKNLMSLSIDRIPVNKGNEAMVFLSFIIQHYDRLPEKVLFVHGHTASWHQNAQLAEILTHLKWEKIDTYLSINNCGGWPFIIRPSNPLKKRESESEDDENMNEQKAFDLFLSQVDFAKYGLKIDPIIDAPACCSQFVVTKYDIRRYPKKLYEEMREWLINTKLKVYYSGRVFEYSWHWFFTGAPKVDRINECKDIFEGYISESDLRISEANLKNNLKNNTSE